MSEKEYLLLFLKSWRALENTPFGPEMLEDHLFVLFTDPSRMYHHIMACLQLSEQLFHRRKWKIAELPAGAQLDVLKMCAIFCAKPEALAESLHKFNIYFLEPYINTMLNWRLRDPNCDFRIYTLPMTNRMIGTLLRHPPFCNILNDLNLPNLGAEIGIEPPRNMAMVLKTHDQDLTQMSASSMAPDQWPRAIMAIRSKFQILCSFFYMPFGP